MSEHLLIKKRQRQRRRGAINLTTRNLLGLVLLALVVYGGFRVWVGNPMESLCGDNCESMYSLLAWVMAFGMVFGAIILAGGVVGVILALIRRRTRNQNSTFAPEITANEPDPNQSAEDRDNP